MITINITIKLDFKTLLKKGWLGGKMSIRMWLVKRQIRKLFRPKWLDTATP
jgi:hypothetical protein